MIKATSWKFLCILLTFGVGLWWVENGISYLEGHDISTIASPDYAMFGLTPSQGLGLWSTIEGILLLFISLYLWASIKIPNLLPDFSKLRHSSPRPTTPPENQS